MSVRTDDRENVVAGFLVAAKNKFDKILMHHFESVQFVSYLVCMRRRIRKYIFAKSVRSRSFDIKERNILRILMMTVDYRILLVAVLEPCALLFSVAGNIIVIYVMTRSEKLTKQSNFYIVSLAIIDLLSGLITIPLAVFSVILNFICMIRIKIIVNLLHKSC